MQWIFAILKRIVFLFGAIALVGFFMLSLVFLGVVFLLTGKRSQIRVFSKPQDFGEVFRREPPRDVTPVKPLELE